MRWSKPLLNLTPECKAHKKKHREKMMDLYIFAGAMFTAGMTVMMILLNVFR